MAQLLGNVATGTIVKLNESGSPVDFYVAQQNYQQNLNGEGYVLLVRKDCYGTIQWNANGINSYANSTIDTWLNNTYNNLLDENIKNSINLTKFQYTPGNGNNTRTNLSRNIFILSLREFGLTYSYANSEGQVLSISNELKIAYYNNSPVIQWTRTPITNSYSNVCNVHSSGVSSASEVNSNLYVRPAFTLPSSLYVLEDGTITTYEIPNAPASINVPTVAKGQPCTITWTAATDPNVGGSIVSYTLQRSVNQSTYQTIYTGSDLTYTDTIGNDWATVSYQVAATNNYGLTGDYTASETQTVSSGVLYVAGPATNLGLQAQPFTFSFSINVTGSTSTVTDISVTVLGDANLIYSGSVSSGQVINVPVDIRVIGGGGHNISVSANKQDYVSIQTFYTFSTNDLNLPSGGMGIQLEDDSGNPLFPQTVASLVKGLYGQNIGDNLQNLIPAVLYSSEARAKYKEVTVDLNTVQVGDIVQLPEDGQMVDFIIGSLNYEPTLNTSNQRVLLIRKNLYQNGQWNSSSVNSYENSTVDTWLNGIYLNLLDQEVKNNIGNTTFPYTPGNGNWTVSNLSRAVFLLSSTESGFTESFFNVEGSNLNITSLLLLQNNQWTRTPDINNNYSACFWGSNGMIGSWPSNFSDFGYRPCFTLPSTFSATYYVDNGNNVYPSQEYISAGVFTDYFGNNIPMVNVETGSYVGTGASGPNNINTIPLSFPAKMVIVQGGGNISGSPRPSLAVFVRGSSYNYSFSMVLAGTSLDCMQLDTSWEDNAFNWCTPSTSQQLNQLNYTGWSYGYIAIG